MNNPAFSAYAALALKVVGTIIIASSILDYLILAVPFQPLNANWQIAFTSQIVDRGIVPMVGIAFLIGGYWLQEFYTGKHKPVSIQQLIRDDSRISSLNIPLDSDRVSGDRLEQLEQIRNRIKAIAEDPKQIDRQYEEALTQLQEQRQQAEKLAKTNALKSGIRIGVNSLLLAIGYIIIGWTGFQGLTGGSSPYRSPPVRER